MGRAQVTTQGGVICEQSCWGYCINLGAAEVARRAVEYVNRLGLDGVDVNYEATDGGTIPTFLGTLLQELKRQLPSGQKIVTFAPLAWYVNEGTPFYNMVAQYKDSIDLVYAQYYNTYPSIHPVGNSAGFVQHVNKLSNAVGKGKTVPGFCNEGCGDLVTATQIATTLRALPADTTGVMVWSVNAPDMQNFGRTVYPNNYIQPSQMVNGCLPRGTAVPTDLDAKYCCTQIAYAGTCP